ncbi:MAG: cysteine desulfurase [Chloroflexi bacterium]|nr:cysteine desulfurase [Chloroflexota bacterium]
MENQKRTYLDYAASTPADPRVVEVMLPYFTDTYGNSSSIHIFGQKSAAAIESARELMADILRCQPKEIIFTSGGSESDNLAIRGATFAARQQREANHILISPVEHPAVSATAQQLEDVHGFELEYITVDKFGLVDPSDVVSRIRPDTAIVSVIFANNEIGTINPITEISAACREQSIPFHTDAVQAAAHMPINLQELNLDLMAIGAHKFYGPKGVGALYVRDGIHLVPTQTGGTQEMDLRAGTLNVPLIVGMAKALHLTQSEFLVNEEMSLALRNRVIKHVLEQIPDAKLTGHPEKRLTNHASFVFKGVDGNMLLTLLDVAGFACSSGSACQTGDPEPSEILLNLNLTREWAFGSLRVSVGHQTTKEEIESFLNILPDVIQRARVGSLVS